MDSLVRQLPSDMYEGNPAADDTTGDTGLLFLGHRPSEKEWDGIRAAVNSTAEEFGNSWEPLAHFFKGWTAGDVERVLARIISATDPASITAASQDCDVWIHGAAIVHRNHNIKAEIYKREQLRDSTYAQVSYEDERGAKQPYVATLKFFCRVRHPRWRGLDGADADMYMRFAVTALFRLHPAVKNKDTGDLLHVKFVEDRPTETYAFSEYWVPLRQIDTGLSGLSVKEGNITHMYFTSMGATSGHI